MKKYLWMMIVIGITSSSCKKVLDTKPADFLNPGQYYQTEAQLNTALIGVYDALGNFGAYKQYLWDQLASGNDIEYYAISNLASSDVRLYNENSSDAIVTSTWNTLYIGINRANGLLQALDSSPASDEVKTKIKAQALFLRGYYYFLLVDLWGGVPLRLKVTTTVEDANFPRSPVKDVYAQVLKDMTEAEAILPEITDLGPTGSGRVSKSAAQGILARVCLTMAGYPLKDESKYKDARDWAQKVISSGLHSLNPDYKQIFINLVQDKYDTKESIWEAEFAYDPSLIHQEYGYLGFSIGIKCGNVDYGYSVAEIGVTEKLWNLYQEDPKDIRRDWNIAPYRFGATDTIKTYFTATQIWNRYPGKWRREYELIKPKHKMVTPTNFPLLRYADVLLMYAEAENGLNGPDQSAMDAVNLVRNRAKATSYLLSDYAKKDDFLKMIQDERARELVCEGIRKRDLIRWGILIETMRESAQDITATAPAAYKYAANGGNNISDRNVLLPIPISEMNLNKALQNKNNPGF